MKKVQVAIYFNKNLGFLIFPFGSLKNGPRIIVDPLVKLEKEASTIEIGSAILTSLSNSEKTLPLSREQFNSDLVLKASGIKSHSKFNHVYEYISCEKKRGCIFHFLPVFWEEQRN